MTRIILLSLVAGAGGTALGGILGACCANRSAKVLSYVLSFAGGVMLSVVCFDLIPEAKKLMGEMWTVLATILGVACIYALHHWLDKVGDHAVGRMPHIQMDEMHHETGLLEAVHARKSLFRAGMVMLFAIGLHNIPEGIAIGAADSYDPSLGMALVILIGLHNMPEGMAISAPLVGGGMRLWSSIGLTTLAGAMTTVSASGTLSVKGDGPTNIKGAVVKIN